MRKGLFAVLGWLSLGIGTIGIFLPLLPTVPLWLLSAWCFSKSSKRLHNWLLNHRYCGPVIRQWQNGQGISPNIKRRAIATIWLSMGISMWLVAKMWLVIVLAAIGIGVTLYLYRLPTTH